jgi:xanthine dehydrogenase accessory factor
MTTTILVRGSGDIGSAVAHRLFATGYAVVIHDAPRPSATRRKMAFCDAIFDGCARLSGVSAHLVGDPSGLVPALVLRDWIPVITVDFPLVLSAMLPVVLVDARMRKHERPETQVELAPFTVGLGPNFTAGETVHAAVETGWGEALGKVIWRGDTKPLEGEPQTIEGHARDRYVYAPTAGLFRTALQPGDMVAAGQEVARIDGTPLYAPIDGILRGLTHDSIPVARKTKVIEVDPRGEPSKIVGIAQRPGMIAAGVLEAVRTWERDNRDAKPAK